MCVIYFLSHTQTSCQNRVHSILNRLPLCMQKEWLSYILLQACGDGGEYGQICVLSEQRQ